MAKKSKGSSRTVRTKDTHTIQVEDWMWREEQRITGSKNPARYLRRRLDKSFREDGKKPAHQGAELELPLEEAAESLERRARMEPVSNHFDGGALMRAKRYSVCPFCQGDIFPGDDMVQREKKALHPACNKEELLRRRKERPQGLQQR